MAATVLEAMDLLVMGLLVMKQLFYISPSIALHQFDLGFQVVLLL